MTEGFNLPERVAILMITSNVIFPGRGEESMSPGCQPGFIAAVKLILGEVKARSGSFKRH